MSELFQKIEKEYYPKKNIYLPENMINDLIADAERFEAFGKGTNLIMNRYLTHLLTGYYSRFTEERRKLAASIRGVLQDSITNPLDLNDKTAAILKLLTPEPPKPKGEKSSKKALSYKPVASTIDYIYDIERTYDGTVSSLSSYLRTMFASYLALPIYERERILFKDNVAKLEKACDDHATVLLTSSMGDGSTLRLVCYKLVRSTEEMFNYLLCYGYNKTVDKDTPYTLRLCRIHNLRLDPNTLPRNPKIESLLSKMIDRAPQYVMYEDETTCVQFTKKGLQAYERIYFGRPNYIGDPEIISEDKINLYFNHSMDQLAFYFSRFRQNQAIVQYPESLANRIKTFHEEAWKAYEKSEPIES